MLDVHPPHSPTHTWKDFLIHIATIVIGLLIAIGLEQTVEWFHHRRQVAETHNALHEEREHNQHDFALATQHWRLDAGWLDDVSPFPSSLSTSPVVENPGTVGMISTRPP